MVPLTQSYVKLSLQFNIFLQLLLLKEMYIEQCRSLFMYVYEHAQVNPANERMLGGGGADGGKPL